MSSWVRSLARGSLALASLAPLSLALLSSCVVPPEPPDAGSAGACEDDVRADTYAAWITRATEGEAFSVVIDRASPSPPRTGLNTWAVRVISRGGGAPVETVRLVARLLDSDREPVRHDAEAVGGSLYSLGPFALPVEGLWETTVEVVAGAETHRARFTFCVRDAVDAGDDIDAGRVDDGGGVDAAVQDGGPLVCDTVAPTACNTPEVRYADVEPVIAARCAVCHDGRADEWPLTSYSHVADWAAEIRGRMLDCTMPPPASGVPMSTEERQLILDWLRCGLPN